MLCVVIVLYIASAVLSLIGLIRPYVAARREAGFARRAQKKRDELERWHLEVAGTSENAAEQERRFKVKEEAKDAIFENSGQTLRWWIETYMFDGRSSNAHAARTAYEQSKNGLRPVAAGVLLGAIASLLSLTL